MQIIIDESLGMPNEVIENAIIKKVELKDDSSLADIVEKDSGGIIAKKLSLKKSDQDSEMEGMIQSLEEYGEILYIYDSFINNDAWLKRIRTWAYPEKKLYLFNGAENRAFTIYLLEQLKESTFEEWYHSSARHSRKFTITNDIKYQSNYLLLKKMKNKQYHLLDSKQQTKITSGKKKDLLEQFMSIPSKEIYIASRKKIMHNNNAIKFFELKNYSLPVCSDQTDIFIPHY